MTERRSRRSRRAVSAWAALVLLAGVAAAAGETPLERHMRRSLTDGDQWTTPNPEHDPEQGGVEAYGLTFELSPDRSHVAGELVGIDAEGKRTLYWTLLAFYNPVTEKVVTQQIGWNGALLAGEVPVQPGPVQVVDMVHYNPDGSLGFSRHENRFESSDRHVSRVLEPKGGGEWAERQSWVWTREPLPAAPIDAAPDGPVSSAANPPPEAAELAPALVPHVGFLLAGSGRWRAPNPAYEAGGAMERFYDMSFRPGAHGQHVIGEIVSVFADGRERRDWTFYITHNPVTGIVSQQQVGGGGVYFEGELGLLENGRHVHAGVIYSPNGQAKSVRDELEILAEDRYESHVFERAADGSWRKAREWVWTRQPVSVPAEDPVP